MWLILISRERNSYNKRKVFLNVDLAFVCQLSTELAMEIKT